MLAFEPPVMHRQGPPSRATHLNQRSPSYYATTQNTMHPSDAVPPRYSAPFQPWKTNRLQSSSSFGPTTTAGPTQLEHTSIQKRRSPSDHEPLSISPFRSVRRMKEPFELKLPASPKSPTGKDPWSPRPPSRERTLRPWRSDQNIKASSMETYGLLPSPPLSASPVSDPPNKPSSIDVLPKGEPSLVGGYEAFETCRYKRENKPWESCPLPQAEEFPEMPPSDGIINVHLAHSDIYEGHQFKESNSPPLATYPEHMPPSTSPLIDKSGKEDANGSPGPQRTREGTVSSDNSFVPNDVSYFETWLQGVPAERMDIDDENPGAGLANRRKFQIVQKSPRPPRDGLSMRPPDKPVVSLSVVHCKSYVLIKQTFAIASRTKPKLVDISPKSSPSMEYADTIHSPKHPLPCTPHQHQQEISAFSPETPHDAVDSGFTTQCSFYAEDEDDMEDDDYTETATMDSECMSSTIVGDQSELCLDEPHSPAISDFTLTTNPPPKPGHSPKKMGNMSEREQLEKLWDHEWTLDQLEHSVKDFPSNMLRLTSPVIMFIRQNNEQAVLRPYRKIFPSTSENLLGSLCASLIARNHITSLSPPNRSSRFTHSQSLYNFNIPDKALNTLGIHIPHSSSTHIKDRVFGSRSIALGKELDRIVDYLLFAISGRSDETLKSAVLVLAETLESKA